MIELNRIKIHFHNLYAQLAIIARKGEERTDIIHLLIFQLHGPKEDILLGILGGNLQSYFMVLTVEIYLNFLK